MYDFQLYAFLQFDKKDDKWEVFKLNLKLFN